MQVTVVDAAGKPREDLLVYVYQTDARGWYAAAAPHVAGNSGDQKHARIFGYARTDERGRFEIETVHPVGYPRSDLPAHVHVELFDRDRAVSITEILFPDDDRLSADARTRAERDGFVVSTQRDATYTAKLVVRR